MTKMAMNYIALKRGLMIFRTFSQRKRPKSKGVITTKRMVAQSEVGQKTAR